METVVVRTLLVQCCQSANGTQTVAHDNHHETGLAALTPQRIMIADLESGVGFRDNIESVAGARLLGAVRHD
jgi:hypothetical protein